MIWNTLDVLMDGESPADISGKADVLSEVHRVYEAMTDVSTLQQLLLPQRQVNDDRFLIMTRMLTQFLYDLDQ